MKEANNDFKRCLLLLRREEQKFLSEGHQEKEAYNLSLALCKQSFSVRQVESVHQWILKIQHGVPYHSASLLRQANYKKRLQNENNHI